MNETNIYIVPPKLAEVMVTIEGITSLLCSRKPDDIGKKASPEKDEEVRYLASLYLKQNGKDVFPAIAIKRSAIDAAHTFATSITKTRARGAFDIPVDWIEIQGDKPNKRVDDGNNPNKRGAAIKIVRAEFKKWKMQFPLIYDINGPLTIDQILNLVNMAGWYVGIGAFRPAKNGKHGKFKIIETK